jgi:ethanolamine utilization cobalamin adenosyltransferase
MKTSMNQTIKKRRALLFAMSAKKHGDDAQRSFNYTKQKVKGNPLDTEGEHLTSLQDGLLLMCDANIALRQQLGAVTAIVVSGQVFNERTNQQLEKVLRER